MTIRANEFKRIMQYRLDTRDSYAMVCMYIEARIPYFTYHGKYVTATTLSHQQFF